MKKFLRKNILNIYLILFLIISYLSIFQASIFLSKSLGTLYYKQIIWYIIGFILIIIIKNLNIKKIYNLSIYLYLINILLLAGLFFFGTEINNSKAWYSIFDISLQPSELMKITLILINSYVIYKFYKNKSKIKLKKEFKLIFTLLLILLVPCILTFLEPDTGAVISYITITLSMLYISGIDKKWFIYLFILVAFLATVFFLTYFYKRNFFINTFGTTFFYRIERIINWKNKSGMQLNNSLIAIGSSGFTGHNHVPIYYPEAGTDFIFTSFFSSYGLIGSVILLTLIFLFDLYLLKLANSIKNKQDKYTVFGIFSLFFYQQIQNISMTLGILPITGITLPFISYGGSSVLSSFILVGIIESIKKYEKKA